LKEPARATTNEGPRYHEIADRLFAEIRTGVHPVGALLPTEQDLCRRFSASRHTVREALRQLQDMGLIARRQGSGSRVLAAQPAQRFTSSVSSLGGLLQYASATSLEILAVEKLVVEGDLGRLLETADGTVWMRVSALRRSEDEPLPIAYTEIFVPARFEEVARRIGAVRTAVYRMLEECYAIQISGVRQMIEAVSADGNQASRLVLNVGEPILRIVRQYRAADGELVEVAVNSHPASRFRYEIMLERTGTGYLGGTGG